MHHSFHLTLFRSLSLLLLLSSVLACNTQQKSNKSEEDTVRTSGYVGIRPLPRSAEEAKLEWLSGIGYYDSLLHPDDFTAKYTDVVMDYKGAFATNKCFFEHYLPFDRDWIDTNPQTNPLIELIRNREKEGMEVEHILICREAELIGKGKWGPFKEDSRILYQRDVDDYRKLFRTAHQQGLVKHDNYKLIQLVTHASFFMENPDAAKIIKSMDGVAYESHQFNRHWPFETGWTRPDELAKGAKWTLDQGLEYIFYYGPFVYKEFEGYTDFIERDWLYRFWDAGLPKHHPNMHFYLNAFPHAHGSKRPVGPESDPHSYLGMLKWLIEEIKGPQPTY